MTETFKTIGDWIEETFGDSNRLDMSDWYVYQAQFDRVKDEFLELEEEVSPPSGTGGTSMGAVGREAADVVISLAGMCRRYGIDLQEEVNKKMVVNREREWAVLPNGTARHISSTKNYDPLGEDFL